MWVMKKVLLFTSFLCDNLLGGFEDTKIQRSGEPSTYVCYIILKRLAVPRRPRIDIIGHYHILNKGVERRVIYNDNIIILENV